MSENDTQWRDHVITSLAKIEVQLGRLTSDRESEKETLIRVTTQLHTEDKANAEKLHAHVKWNDEEHKELHDKVNGLSLKFWFAAGVFAALQLLAPLVWKALIVP